LPPCGQCRQSAVVSADRIWLLLLLSLFGSASPLHYAAWGGHAHITRQLLLAATASEMLMLQGCRDVYDRWAWGQPVSPATLVAAFSGVTLRGVAVGC
jgi:hypothetical protein